MKQVVYLGDEDVAVTFAKTGKTVIMQNRQLYVVDTDQYRDSFDPISTKDAE